MYRKYWKHFKMVMRHKFYVYKACSKAGIRWRGIVHDLSKFSPTEFRESAKYFTGVKSPIEVAKETQGFSRAWFHHRGRNKHHWAYWVDNLSEGGVPTLMPYEYALEMICDYIGAGQAYEGDSWTFKGEYEWFLKQEGDRSKTHPAIVDFMDSIFWTMKEQNSYDALDKEFTKSEYVRCALKHGIGISALVDYHL